MQSLFGFNTEICLADIISDNIANATGIFYSDLFLIFYIKLLYTHTMYYTYYVLLFIL